MPCHAMPVHPPRPSSDDLACPLCPFRHTLPPQDLLLLRLGVQVPRWQGLQEQGTLHQATGEPAVGLSRMASR